MTEQDNDVTARGVIDRAEAKNIEFKDLLDKITYASNETKKIWKEIYENAVDDRSHAFLLFADLYRFVSNNERGHIDHGKQITMYLERMNKANDQLLKLAELVEHAADDDDAIDAGALYEELNSQ